MFILKGDLTQDSAKCLWPGVPHPTFPSAQSREGGTGGSVTVKQPALGIVITSLNNVVQLVLVTVY